ncbi:acyltransferase [Xylanibacter caecicola]|uniref:acyltransferase n=1 Tax=Xylanibacter caecicola TaxID=2736294 RepID=UPI0025911778|nr:hypothetical protein [Xylanibacter caecicola]
MNLRKFLNSFSFLKHVYYHIHGIDVSIHKTLIANLSAFPLKDAIKLPIIVYQGTEIEQIGKIKFNCPIRKGILVIGKRMFFRGQKTVIINRGTIEIDGDCEIMGGTTIHTLRYCSRLHLGNNVMIGEHVRILVDTEVSVGDCTRFSFDSIVIDSEFHFILNTETGAVGTTRCPIKIGRYNWIGNTTVIKKGTITPDYTIVSNGSMLTKDFSDIPNYSILLGVPAKLKATGFRRIYNEVKDRELNDYFMEHTDKRKIMLQLDANDPECNQICNDEIYVHVH